MDRDQQGLAARYKGKPSGDETAVRRVRITIGGRVQGVGFRPSVYRHATAMGLTGFVRNTARGVEVEAQGTRAQVHRFLSCLRSESPRQAHVESMEVTDIPAVTGEQGFQIVPSARSGDLLVGFPPDLATCSECVRELFTPGDRRYRYPFINCVNCGPRFTIIAELPYDRASTSMAMFPLCPACRREFEDPRDRRFDAQPNACPICGPQLALLDADGQRIETEDPVASAVAMLKAGKILAIKGIGGFHLCCDAKNDEAVLQLRIRKGRREKPFAVMFATCAQVGSFTAAGPDEIMELLSPAAPVVVARRKPAAPLSKWISPDTDDIGVMLPYSPVHHLLLRSVSPLIMTSGNISEEPIAHDETTLRRILGRVADAALVHNRDIVRRCDDSVMKVVGGRRLMLRRSRGFVPQSIGLPFEGPPILAVGAELKNTFCITRGRKAFLSQHIGDLIEHPSWMFFLEAVEDLAVLLKIKPVYVVHDRHPAYESTRFAETFPASHRIAVQHHHAHIAACMAEHGLTGRVLGVAFDGSGMGDDQTIWGGEFLLADYTTYRRVAHIKPFCLPGGDEAVRHPPRTALGVLCAVLDESAEAVVARCFPSLRPEHRRVLFGMIRSKFRSPITTSVGRLFDAVAALLGLCDEIHYEGQAAIRLQTLAARGGAPRMYELECTGDPHQGLVLDYASLVRSLLEDVEKGVPRENIALGFHDALARGVAALCRIVADAENVDRVVLSGGVFQNDLLLQLTEAQLRAAGFIVYWPHDVPPNDAGISLGQAAVALARLTGS